MTYDYTTSDGHAHHVTRECLCDALLVAACTLARTGRDGTTNLHDDEQRHVARVTTAKHSGGVGVWVAIQPSVAPYDAAPDYTAGYLRASGYFAYADVLHTTHEAAAAAEVVAATPFPRR
jgi:hypothetical protein